LIVIVIITIIIDRLLRNTKWTISFIDRKRVNIRYDFQHPKRIGTRLQEEEKDEENADITTFAGKFNMYLICSDTYILYKNDS